MNRDLIKERVASKIDTCTNFGFRRDHRGAIRMLRARGANTVWHRHGTLLDHLVRTAVIVAKWGGCQDAINCALFHSVYGTHPAAVELFPIAERDALRSVIGARAESLVYLFATLRRGADYQYVRWRGDQTPVENEDIGLITAVDIANTVDQSCGSDDAPGLWIADAQALLLSSKLRLPDMPEMLRLAPKITREQEETARSLYEESLAHLTTSRRAAEEYLIQCIGLQQVAGEPFLILAMLQRQRGRWAEAFQNASAGLQRLGQLGAAWDKRASFEQWLCFGQRLSRG